MCIISFRTVLNCDKSKMAISLEYLCIFLLSACAVAAATSENITNGVSTTERILSRKRRYLVFPEGSSFSGAVCMTIGVIGKWWFSVVAFNWPRQLQEIRVISSWVGLWIGVSPTTFPTTSLSSRGPDVTQRMRCCQWSPLRRPKGDSAVTCTGDYRCWWTRWGTTARSAYNGRCVRAKSTSRGAVEQWSRRWSEQCSVCRGPGCFLSRTKKSCPTIKHIAAVDLWRRTARRSSKAAPYPCSTWRWVATRHPRRITVSCRWRR